MFERKIKNTVYNNININIYTFVFSLIFKTFQSYALKANWI